MKQAVPHILTWLDLLIVLSAGQPPGWRSGRAARGARSTCWTRLGRLYAQPVPDRIGVHRFPPPQLVRMAGPRRGLAHLFLIPVSVGTNVALLPCLSLTKRGAPDQWKRQ